MKIKPETILYNDTVQPDVIISKTARGDVMRRSPGMPILLDIASRILAQNINNVSSTESLNIAQELINGYNGLINQKLEEQQLGFLPVEKAPVCMFSGDE